jgi:hypothetical protein
MSLAFVALALAVAVSAVASPGTSRVIRSDEWIGTYAVKKDGTLGGAIRAFGKPTSLTPSHDGFCGARWSGLGLRVMFYNLGGQDPCGRATGFFGEASISGRGWRTSRGAAVGDSLARLRQVFPAATPHGRRWWLVPRFTQATGSYAGLSAGIRGGKVVDFQVIFGKGGE